MNEKRRFTRIEFDSQATLSANEQEWETELIDISLRGVLLEKPDGWVNEENQIYKLDVHLDDDEFTIEMDIRQAHQNGNKIGFRCEQIDLESAALLRRLVELNIGNDDLLDREISVMFG